jgi:hypothetical protein
MTIGGPGLGCGWSPALGVRLGLGQAARLLPDAVAVGRLLFFGAAESPC